MVDCRQTKWGQNKNQQTHLHFSAIYIGIYIP